MTQDQTQATTTVASAIHALNLVERITLTPAQLAVKAKVDVYEHPGVIWKLMTDEGMTSEQAMAAFSDMKNFLFCIYMKQDTEFAMVPTPAIDKPWHQFILFTPDYGPFCVSTFGYFVHHMPNVSVKDVGKTANCKTPCTSCLSKQIKMPCDACSTSCTDDPNKKAKVEGPQAIKKTLAHAKTVLGELSPNWSFGGADRDDCGGTTNCQEPTCNGNGTIGKVQLIN